MTTTAYSQALLALALSAALGTASAGPVAGGQLGLLVDGTSNTLLLTEQTQVTACIRLPVGNILPTITDGSSNTLLFGEAGAFTLRTGSTYAWAPIGSIVDGTSNTIFIGEATNSLCVGGETSVVDFGDAIVDGVSNTIQIPEGGRLDLCLRNVSIGRVTDGTSNTVLFGEVTSTPTCFENVRVTATEPGSAAVPLPGTLPLLALGAAGLWSTRRRFHATKG